MQSNERVPHCRRQRWRLRLPQQHCPSVPVPEVRGLVPIPDGARAASASLARCGSRSAWSGRVRSVDAVFQPPGRCQSTGSRDELMALAMTTVRIHKSRRRTQVLLVFASASSSGGFGRQSPCFSGLLEYTRSASYLLPFAAATGDTQCAPPARVDRPEPCQNSEPTRPQSPSPTS